MSDIKVIVTTCDKTAWSVQPFAHLFNTYWSENQEVTVLCESMPDFRLPDNFKTYVVTVGEEKWPLERWTDGLLKYLNSIREQHLVILLDDYWFTRTVDYSGIATLLEFMRGRPDLLRIDLTTDRLYAGGVGNAGIYGHYDLVEAPGSQYQMSLMPGLWNKKLLMDIIIPGWSPWDVELTGTAVLNEKPDIHVYGTRQNPIRFVNALRAARKDINVNDLDPLHVEYIKKFFPPKMEVTNFIWHQIPEDRKAE